ncbi:MAG TPA: glycosyltransferase family 39 protein [Gemmataceae bacterium]|nr:glycosyltransferase family 39 protein [Gemmataceae bacterium]
MSRQSPGRRWWREAEFALVLVLACAAYLPRLGELPARGEEPRRAQVACELVSRHDWLVPREQGEPFLSRPPAQNWLIATTCLAVGSWEEWAIRLPSALATVLLTLLIYGYARTGLSRVGALAAALAFATLGEMFPTGRQAESEAVFILFLGGALLAWHWAWLRGRPALAWAAGYVLMALAALTKGGPQPPVYFVGSVTAYLVLTRQWRRLLTRAHLAGALLGVAVIAAWAVPYYFDQGWDNLRALWMGDTASRFEEWKLSEVVLHLASYPLEVLGCTAPWSLLLLAYLGGGLRRSLGEARPQAVFAAVCVGLAFPSCWLPPGGQTRYLTPIYPCLAVLIGAVVERCGAAAAAPELRAGWRWYLRATTALAAGTAAFLAATPWLSHPWLAGWAAPPGRTLAYVVACLALAGLIAWAGRAARVRLAVVALACFMVLLFVGVLADVRLRRTEDTAAAVRRLKERLPPGAGLVSLGHIDAIFAYHYGEPIPALAGRYDGVALAAGQYFCVDGLGNTPLRLPFAWEPVAALSMDRNRHERPDRLVVVGRRLPPGSPPASLSASR